MLVSLERRVLFTGATRSLDSPPRDYTLVQSGWQVFKDVVFDSSQGSVLSQLVLSSQFLLLLGVPLP